MKNKINVKRCQIAQKIMILFLLCYSCAIIIIGGNNMKNNSELDYNENNID